MAAYKRPTIGGWLIPAMVGPWVSTYGAVSLYAAVGPEVPYIGRWGAWALGMGIGTLFAGFHVLVLVLVDVLLLALRQRILPTGKSAWAMALGAPLVPLATFVFVRPWTFWRSGPWAVALAVLVPVIVSSFGARIAWGQKTQVKGAEQ